jgi:hypothetical protein
MAEKVIRVTVSGLDDVDRFIKKFEKKLEFNVQKGFIDYVKKHLLRRIQSRLAAASHSQASSKDKHGLVTKKAGGYGTPKNSPKYKEWKESQENLPLAGDLTTRELVATGHLVNSIKITKLSKALGNLYVEVGPESGIRPKTSPMKSTDNIADTSQVIDNLKLAEMLEDSEYAFWMKEFEDVQRDMVPLVTKIVRETIHQLIKEYGKK